MVHFAPFILINTSLAILIEIIDFLLAYVYLLVLTNKRRHEEEFHYSVLFSGIYL